MAQILLDGGASKSAKNNQGQTPYDVVCYRYYVTCDGKDMMELESLLSLWRAYDE